MRYGYRPYQEVACVYYVKQTIDDDRARCCHALRFDYQTERTRGHLSDSSSSNHRSIGSLASQSNFSCPLSGSENYQNRRPRFSVRAFYHYLCHFRSKPCHHHQQRHATHERTPSRSASHFASRWWSHYSNEASHLDCWSRLDLSRQRVALT